MSVTQRLEQVPFHDDATTRHVDDPQFGLGFEQDVAIDETDGLFVLGQVHREEVRGGHQLVEWQHVDVQLSTTLHGNVRVERNDPHSESECTMGDEFADSTEPDDAQRLAGQFDSLPLGSLPATIDEGGMRLGNVSSHRHEEGDGVLGGGHDVGLGCVRHHDTRLGGRLHIDVVETNAGSPDDDESTRCREYRRIDVGCTTHDERLCATQRLDERVSVQTEADVDVVTGGPQTIETSVGDFFGYEDACHPSIVAAPTPCRNGVIVTSQSTTIYFSLAKDSQMAHPFLSPEWMEAARAIREKYRDQAPKVAVVVRFNQVVTDVPFGDGVIHSHMDTSSGEVVMDLGHLDKVDATLTTDYVTARTIFVEQDPQRAMEAFFTGKVKVEGDMLKLMAMQTAMPQTELGLVVAEEIRSITER